MPASATSRRMLHIASRPVYILHELVDLLCRERIVLPGDTILQNMVHRALAFERKRLAGALEGSMATELARAYLLTVTLATMPASI